MAQKVEILCDRCGKELVNPVGYYCPTYALKEYSAKITLWGVGEPRSGFGQRIDLLLANGVIVPPCKVGDVVYEIDLPEYGVIVCEITKVLCDSRVVVVNVIYGHGNGSEYYFEFDDFGKTVFLTKEEAEQALKGGAKMDGGVAE